jgi:hypothetical protein
VLGANHRFALSQCAHARPEVQWVRADVRAFNKKLIMKKQAIAAALLCAFASGAALSQTTAAEGPWMVRARAVHLNSANGDTTPLRLTINDKWIPKWTCRISSRPMWRWSWS